MSIPKYSVIIPLYNKERFIKQTLESVLCQSISDFEIIVVDDGSTDRSTEIVRSIRDSRVHLISQENQGVSKARNTGIDNSKGDYVCFLDADDLWHRDFLFVVNILIKEFPEARVYCPSYEVDYIKRKMVPHWRSVDQKKDSLVRDFYEMATAPFWVTISSNTVLERKALFSMDCWFPEGETVYEDLDFWIRVGSHFGVAHSNKVCATYRRITEVNARTVHVGKVVYSKTFMDTLHQLMADPDIPKRRKYWIAEIIDRRMVPYFFSLLLMKESKRVSTEIDSWKPAGKYKIYKLLLKVACKMPYSLITAVQSFRYRIL